jgi:hypothetical protein
MNIDQDYKRRVRITGKPGEVTPYTIEVRDIDTDECIDNVFRAEIWLDANEINVARLHYYVENGQGNCLVDENDELIKGIATVPVHEIDVTAYERS